MRKFLYIFVLFSFFLSIESYADSSEIKTKELYIHTKTGFKFPLQIDKFKRENIFSFDDENKNIGVKYKTKYLKTTITVYVYPAKFPVENRLRNEFKKSLSPILSEFENGILASRNNVSYKKDGFKINGFKAVVKNLDNNTILSVYECGKWFFKLKISSNKLDLHWVDSIEQKFFDFYNLTNLVKISKLDNKPTIYYYGNAFIDSTFLGSIMYSSMEKVRWLTENVDTLESISGLQDSYLFYHIEALKKFLEFEIKFPNYERTLYTDDFLNELKSINNNGFLEEFILDQYDMLMIIPKNIIFDFDGYYKWKSKNPITTVDLKKIFYLIWYDNKN